MATTYKVSCKTAEALLAFIDVCERRGLRIHYPILVEDDSDDQEADIKIELDRGPTARTVRARAKATTTKNL